MYTLLAYSDQQSQIILRTTLHVSVSHQKQENYRADPCSTGYIFVENDHINLRHESHTTKLGAFIRALRYVHEFR